MAAKRVQEGKTTEDEDAYVIIQVHTDEGVVGIGEGGRSLSDINAQAERYIGKNPLVEMDLLTLGRPWAHALLDIMGKALDVPGYRILGNGKHRDRVPVAYWSPHVEPNQTARHAEEGARLGYTLHKIKAREWDVVDQVKAITGAGGPDYGVRVDPNERFYNPATTVRIDNALHDYPNIECFEDPVPRNRPEWYGLLRRKCRIPMAIHCRDTRLILDHIRHDGIDYVNVGGTIDRALRSAAVADAAGCPVWLAFEGHCLDIQAAFDAHVGAAIPNATLPYDSRPFMRDGSITVEGYGHSVVDGHLDVPEAPGLGVTLDLNACERYRVE